MRCPYCGVAFHKQPLTVAYLGDVKNYGSVFAVGRLDGDHVWAESQRCPQCTELIAWLVYSTGIVPTGNNMHGPAGNMATRFVHPKSANRSAPPEVPSKYAEDFREASLILEDSPKASAALSRRCLQLVLRERAGVNGKNLYEEIEAFISEKTLPSHISEALHNLRQMGNVASHPMRNQDTGLILPIEPGEAEWCLDIVEELFDFYFIGPTKLANRQSAWEQKYRGGERTE